MKRKLAPVLAAAASAAVFVAGTVAGVVTASPPCWAGHGGDKSCASTTTASSTTAATTTTATTATVATTTASATGYVFDDEFDGSAGAAPDPTKWVNRDGINWGNSSTAKAANAFLNGNGQLVLRVKREPLGYGGRFFSGGTVGTYQYETGWPPSPILHSWPVPFRYEARVLLPNVQAAWDTFGWNQNVDRTTAQDIYELDVGETRTTFPTVFGENQHDWLNGSDVNGQGGSQTGSDGRFIWHTVAVEATTTETRYYLDGVLGATHFGVSGRFGVLLHNQIADAGTWGSGGVQPAPSDPGPWDMLVDYVRVTSL